MKRYSLALSVVLMAGCDADTDTDTPDTTESCDTDSMVLFTDADGDGYGDPEAAFCSDEAASGAVDNGLDCDDSDETTHPGAAELCDGLDNDCDGSADAGVTSVFYADADEDGHGSAAVPMEACVQPDGFTESDDDCDDSNAAVYPGAAEVCDGVSNDCGAASWSAADEDGMASFFAADGTITDYSDMSGEQVLSVPGTLRLCDGRWQANISVTAADVSIIGSGEDDTIIDGGDAGAVISAVGADGLWLEALTVTGGTGNPCSKGDTFTCGGGLHLIDSDYGLAEISVIGNIADAGGGILSTDSEGWMDDVTISGNSSTFNGGGLFFAGIDSGLELMGSIVEGNTSTVGGGIIALDAATVSISETEIRDNLALFYGGGMSVDRSGDKAVSATITDSVFAGNQADNIYCDGSSCYGGALYVGAASVTMSGTEVSDSFALSLGGGVYVTEEGDITGTSSTFEGNDPDDIYDEETGSVLSPDSSGDFAVE